MEAEQFRAMAAAEMAEYLQRVREQPSELLVGEWNSLSLIYKNAVDSRRAARRVITSVEQNEKPEGKEQLASHARKYVAEVEGELQKIRDGILAIMDKNLISLASTDESKVLYYKMKSDYYRYLAECATGDAMGKAAEGARVAHAEATKTSSQDRTLQCTAEQILDFPCRKWRNSRWKCRRPFPKTKSSSGLWSRSLTFQFSSLWRNRQWHSRFSLRTGVNRVSEDRPLKPLIFHSLKRPLRCLTLGRKIRNSLSTRMFKMSSTQLKWRSLKITKLTVQRKKPIIQEKMNQVTKPIEFPQVRHVLMAQTVQKMVEVPPLQFTVVSVVQAPQVQVSEKTVEISQLQAAEKIVETRGTHTIQSTQTSEKLGTASVCRSTQAEIVEAVEIGVIPPAESARLMFVTTPVLETPPVVAEYVQLAPAAVPQETTQEVLVPVAVPKKLDSPQVQLIDKVVSIPVMAQSQVPSAPRVQKIVEMSKMQFSDGHVDMPVVAQRQVPMIPNVQKTVEVPQIQYIDKIVDAPVVARSEDVSVGTQTVSRKRKTFHGDRVC